MVNRGAGRPGGKAALYARLSKTDEGVMDNQLDRLREWAENLGYDEVSTYEDRASGATLDRPDLDRLMADVRTGTFDVVLVVRIDRLMRSVLNLLSVLEHCSTYGTALKVLDQPIDTATPMGRLVLTILAAIAEFERELIRDRTMDGLERARKEGTQLGRKTREFSDEFYDRLMVGRDGGMSWKQLSKELGEPIGTLRDHYRRVAVDVPPDNTSKYPPVLAGRQPHGSRTEEEEPREALTDQDPDALPIPEPEEEPKPPWMQGMEALEKKDAEEPKDNSLPPCCDCGRSEDSCGFERLTCGADDRPPPPEEYRDELDDLMDEAEEEKHDLFYGLARCPTCGDTLVPTDDLDPYCESCEKEWDPKEVNWPEEVE